MPFALLTMGILFIVIGFQDTYKEFGTQVANDFSGDHSFFWFLLAIGVVGAIGYIKPLETVSRSMLALILIALFLGAVNQGGFFGKLSAGIAQGSTAPINPIGTPLPNAPGGVSSGGSGGGGSDSGVGDAVKVISTIAEIASFS